jgi:hypothetical protein
MNKKIIASLFPLVILAIIAGFIFYGKPMSSTAPVSTGPDAKNMTYVIDGRSITLVDGKSEVPAAPGSATIMTTTLFGEPVSGDLNGDGKPDLAVYLVQDPVRRGNREW